MAGITLRQLEIFVQIVDLGSFRRCAEEIGISQVAITDHIQGLERQIGISLFDRKPGAAARVTAMGEKAYLRAMRILSEVNALEWECTPDRQGGPKRRITLASQGFVLRDLYEEFDLFRADHPRVSLAIRLEPLGYGAIRDLLQENRIDLAYIMSVDDPGLFPSHFVSYEHLAVYVGPDHPLAGETSVTAADLRPYRTIRLGPNGHLRAAVDEVLMRCGLGMVGTGLETDDYGLILNTLQRTPCFAVMLKGQPDEALPHGGLVPLPVSFPVPPLQLREAFSAIGARDSTVLNLAQRIRERQEMR